MLLLLAFIHSFSLPPPPLNQDDTQIIYYELNDYAPPHVNFLTMFQSRNPHGGAGFMPKRHLDYMRCEVARFYRLQHTEGMVEPVAMTVPRKVCVCMCVY